jgi:hypothetical protein
MKKKGKVAQFLSQEACPSRNVLPNSFLKNNWTGTLRVEVALFLSTEHAGSKILVPHPHVANQATTPHVAPW